MCGEASVIHINDSSTCAEHLVNVLHILQHTQAQVPIIDTIYKLLCLFPQQIVFSAVPPSRGG